MKTSSTIAKFAAAFLKAQQAITHAEKKADNPFFKSKYADLPTVIEAIKPALNDNGITFIQLPSEGPAGTLTLSTMLLHESGEWIESAGSCPLGKQDPQAFGSAMTYFRRYALAGVTGLFQADDDAEGSMRPQAQQTPKTAVSAPVRATASPVQVPREPLDPAGAGWRDVTVPKFIKKWAGATLGEMEEQDLLYWAGAYTPKEYPPGSGKISQKDIDFRKALDAAQAELNADVSYDQTKPDNGNPY